MDNFEQRLKDLPWRGPSSSLKQRIFDRQATTVYQRLFYIRRVAVGWAAVVVIAAGLSGYWWGHHAARVTLMQPLPEQAIDVRMIETGMGQNLFDMVSQSSDILPAELVASLVPVEDI